MVDVVSGTHSIAAVYSGGPDLTGSDSSPVTVAVAQALTGTVTSLTTI